MSQTFTRKQVAERGDKNTGLFVIDNVVYNVTPFLDEHPGGHEVLLNQVGKDASEDFDDIGHSADAKELMKKFVVGELVAEDRVETKKRDWSWGSTGAGGSNADSSFLSSWKLPVLLGILATILYSYLLG